MKRRDIPPCPVCGRTKDRQHCWRDPAHGAYYAAQKTTPLSGDERHEDDYLFEDSDA